MGFTLGLCFARDCHRHNVEISEGVIITAKVFNKGERIFERDRPIKRVILELCLIFTFAEKEEVRYILSFRTDVFTRVRIVVQHALRLK